MHLTSACGADIKKSEKQKKRRKKKKDAAVIEVKRKACERYELPIGRKKEKSKFGVLANRISS